MSKPSGTIVKVAAVQAAPVGFDLPATLAKVRTLVGEAAIEGAQLVVLPEAFSSAYPRHWGFAIGSRSEEQREWYGRYVQSSVKVPENALHFEYTIQSPPEGEDFWAFGQLSDTARTNKIVRTGFPHLRNRTSKLTRKHLSVGIIERSLIGSTLWCTNLLFSPSGRLLSKHRKLQPTAAERVVWSQGEATFPVSSPAASAGEQGKREERVEGKVVGDNMAVAQTELGRVGGLICWENFMPLARYVLYKKGVEIYTAPTADARPTWLPVMQHIAQEGRCYVVSANQFHTSRDFPDDYPANKANPNGPAPGANGSEEAAVWSRGGSCIVGPLGEVLAGPLWDKEGILFAELDMDKLHGARLDFNPVGHYGREDLLLGLLNELH